MKTKCILFIFYCWIAFISISACQSESEIKRAQFFSNGKSIYTAKCENCHGKQGEGLGQLYPSLTDSTFLQRNRAKLPCIIKHGTQQEIMIHGKKFDTPMPSNGQLTDQEIAYVLTYIGNTFGNELGLVSTEEVQKDLSSCK